MELCPFLKGHNDIFCNQVISYFFFLVIAFCKYLVMMIFCNQDILKTIKALSFKLGQVMEDNE